MTRVVNLRRARYDLYIGRPGPWGNPYVIGRDGTRIDIIRKYEWYLRRRIRSGEITARDLAEHYGKALGCYCKPSACHGDALARYIDRAHRYLAEQ